MLEKLAVSEAELLPARVHVAAASASSFSPSRTHAHTTGGQPQDGQLANGAMAAALLARGDGRSLLPEDYSGRGVCVCLRASWLLSLTRRAHLHRGVCVCAALALPLVSQRPIGRVKRIEFKDVKEIEELEYGEFVLQCSKRDYTFKARMRSHRGSVSCLPTRDPRPRSLPDARSLTLAP